MFLLLPLFSTFPQEFAYLDPGSGSLIVQMLIAAVVGGGVLLRAFWGRLFGKNKKTENEIDDSDEDLEEY